MQRMNCSVGPGSLSEAGASWRCGSTAQNCAENSSKRCTCAGILQHAIEGAIATLMSHLNQCMSAARKRCGTGREESCI
jgi:hypothetical protein